MTGTMREEDTGRGAEAEAETDTRRAEEEVHQAQADELFEGSLIDLCRFDFYLNIEKEVDSTINIMNNRYRF
jgi:hypothetical protein